jgi:RNA polymerase sigma factor (sigma-70 family)
MADRSADSVLKHIRRIAVPDAADAATDRQLLERFRRHQDEGAFETLVRRHAPLVWGVCRRILSDAHAADDAFQATFLVFVRKAKAIGRGELLSQWLYGVAYRVAIRAKANAARRRWHESRAEIRTSADPGDEAARRDLEPILDEEIQRLPPKYRIPIILCYLQGKTNEEAARELGCPKGTILSRLARARDRLRTRLTRRGLGLSIAALTAGLSARTASAAVPLALLDATLQAGLQAAAGNAMLAGAASPSAATLAKGALQTMFLTKWIAVAGLFLAASILGTSTGVLSYRLAATQAAAPDQPPQDPAVATRGIERTDLVKVASPMEGIIWFIGTEIKPGDQVPPAQVLSLTIGKEVKRYRRLKKGDRVEEGQLLARLDDRLARDEYAIKQKKVEEVETDYKASLAIRDEYNARWDTQIRLLGGKGGVAATSREDERNARVQWSTAMFQAESKQKAVEGAKLELKKAQTVLAMHEIRCRTSGVIQAIAKHPGEAVQKLETVVVIRIADK